MGASRGVESKKTKMKRSAKQASSSSALPTAAPTDDQRPPILMGGQSGEPATNGSVPAPAPEGVAPETPGRVLETTPANGNLVVVTNLLRDAFHNTAVLIRLTWLISVVAAAVWLVAEADIRLMFLSLAMMGWGGTVAAVANAIVKARSRRQKHSEDETEQA